MSEGPGKMGLFDRALEAIGLERKARFNISDLNGTEGSLIGSGNFGDYQGLQGMVNIPSWASTQGAFREFTADKGIRDGFKVLSWIYSCVTLTASTLASAKWIAVKEPSPGKFVRQVGHPLEKLVRKPNPFLTTNDLVEIISTHLELSGNSLFLKVRARDNHLMELWPLAPDRTEPVLDQRKFLTGYTYAMEGFQDKTYRVKDVIHLKLIDPSNLSWGMSPLQAAKNVINAELKAIGWNRDAMANRAVPDGIVSFKHPLSKKQFEGALKQIKDQVADRPRGPLVLSSEATWASMALSPAEMDFINSRKFSREEICSIYGIPPPLIGILDNATLANIYTARRILWVDKIIPRLTKIQQTLNHSLVGEFDDDTFLMFDIAHIDVMLDHLLKQIEGTNKLWIMGTPLNQASDFMRTGLPEVEGGDVAYVNVPLAGEAGRPISPGTEPIPAPDGTSDTTKPTKQPD